MSLFAAYADKTQETTANNEEQWLKSTSFLIPPVLNSAPSDSDSFDETEDTPEPEPLVNIVSEKKADGVFFIDKKRVKDFLKMKTFSKHSIAKYNRNYYLKKSGKTSRRKFKRYFFEADVALDDELFKSDSKKESDLTRITSDFNMRLCNEPKNIDLWLKFIEFQDKIFAGERHLKKGSLAKGVRANAERKLSILEKALSKNPNSDPLLRKRIEIISAVYPADEIQNQLKSFLDKDQSNIVNWQGYIEATQCSMSHCNATSVLALYSKSLMVLHKIRRNASLEKHVLEEHILRILYQCGLFLKQSGLYERLWLLLKMYLELNLSPNNPDKFTLPTNFDEKQLTDLEDLVLKSKLPSHELWLRTEKLRESCHWLPLADENCEDPQRVVFNGDVVELIHPVTLPDNVFRLTSIALTLLKVPLLPYRHCTMHTLGLDYVPWALDSIETLLPICLPMYAVDFELGDFMGDNQLAVGPQYLKMLPAQEEYLLFVLEVMSRCIDSTENEEKLALTVWWFKFQRLLLVLDTKKKLKLGSHVKKRIRSDVKKLLKQAENRSNVLYYCEYALMERDHDPDSCLKILKTALSFSDGVKISASSVSDKEKAHCHLVRTYVECLLLEESSERTETVKKCLVNFVHGRKLDSEIDEELLNNTGLMFKHNTLQMFEKHLSPLTPAQHFLPLFACDWIILHVWFVYVTKNALDCGTFLEELIGQFNGANLYEEVMYEFYVSVLFKFCMKRPEYGLFKPLDEVLCRAVKIYPNNMFLLSAISKMHIMANAVGPSFWKVKDLLIKTGHSLPVLFLVNIAHQIHFNHTETIVDTITGNKLNLDANFKNFMLSLYRQVTRTDVCTRRCGLIWRLYLQFVHKHFDPKQIRNTYYSAMEECPWLKALYIDAAIYVPEDLGQIQDLLIEKELRLHVTPEELDILRE